MRRVLYGGSFDPVHTGHVTVAEAAGKLLGADRVSLVPAFGAPHKNGRTYASAEHRLAMVQLAVADHPLLDVLDEEIRRGGLSYTIDTVHHLLAGPCAGDSLMLLVGQDSLPDLPTWKDARKLAETVPIVVVPRPGAVEPDWDDLAHALGAETIAGIRSRRLPTPSMDVSSTDVRARLRDGRSARCRVPDRVVDYILEHGLYAADVPPVA